MNTEWICEAGAGERLPEYVRQAAPRRVLLVTGRRSFRLSGAEALCKEALAGFDVIHFQDFEENPKLGDVERGLALCEGSPPDLVVAVGGGTAMDMAKMIALFAAAERPPIDYVEGRAEIQPGEIPLIALPTTAGSGSQATHFSAVYVDKTKYSVAHPSMLPTLALVDPNFLSALPKHVAAASGLDALNQGIESFWSIHATADSKKKAREAIALAWEHLPGMVLEKSADARLGMAKAAHLAGQAIDITKTTAPHAISYPITAYFGVPHGHAVGLVLPGILAFNAGVEKDDCLHPEGPEHVRETLQEIISMLGASTTEEATTLYTKRMKQIGLSSDPRAFAIGRPRDIDLIVANGFNPQRVNNNPRRLTETALREMLMAMI
ncbi:MAG: phosphonoacetaldehyde reductase [Myxococcota bacterium]